MTTPFALGGRLGSGNGAPEFLGVDVGGRSFQSFGLGAALGGGQPGMQQDEFDIRLDRAPRQQRKILEYKRQRVEAIGRRRAAQFGLAQAWLQQPAENL